MMPSLQHVSIDVCSDAFDDSGSGANSENGDLDFDIRGEEDSEEEDDEEEFSGEDDDSQIDDLIDDLEVKFRTLVLAKIGEAEEFFDDANTMQRTCVIRSVIAEQPENEVVGPLGNNNGSLPPPQLPSESRTEAGGSSGKSGGVGFQCSEVGTQTEDDAFLTKSSGTLVSNENMCNREESLEPEQARLEIGQLREVRDSLVAQRQQWEAQRKQTDERNEDALKKAECKVYEIEEAIEAVETAIEFKNEIIVGQQPRKSVVGDGGLDPNETQLVTRLESLSIEELRRLLCVYFAKVVELRYSSRRLEKNVEQIETLNEQISRRLAREHKHLKEMDEEYQTRIRLILTSNNSNSSAYMWYRRMDDQLASARKKQHDLERSLTALLVRHGYLVNGADYDVKQVVKMLGIENQLAGQTSKTRGEGSSAAGTRGHSSTAHHSRAGWHKGGKSSHEGHSLSSRRNGRVLNGHELMRVHKEPRVPEGWEREREQKHDRHVFAPQPARREVETVRREKGRLIILPSSGAPSSSNYEHAGPSNRNNHHSHGHHSHHGSAHHGYK